MYQLLLIPVAIIPGILVVFGVVTPVQAACLVLLAYILSRRIDNAAQKKLEEDRKKEEDRRKREEEAIARLPAKKRKNVEKGIARKNEESKKG